MNIQKLVCREGSKSRASNSGLRYTNSLPTEEQRSRSDIPSHLRQIIDRLGCEPNPTFKQKTESSDEDAEIIRFVEDGFSERNSEKDSIVLVEEERAEQRKDDSKRTKTDIEYLLSKSDIRQLSYEDEESYEDYEHSEQSQNKNSGFNESFNDKVEVYHLEDFGNEVIEEKAEEEEASSVNIYSNKPYSEEFSSVVAAEISDDDSRILDETSVSRRSINTSQINFKRICTN